MSIISGEGIHHSKPQVLLSGRRRSSTSLPPPDVSPKLTRLPHKKFAITRDSVEASMARDNAARPPCGLATAPSAFRQSHPPLGQPRRIPLAEKEQSIDDGSSVSSFMSSSQFGSFRRRNSYEHAMRKTHLPPIAHPLRDKRTAAAKAARAVRIIERLKEEDDEKKRVAAAEKRQTTRITEEPPPKKKNGQSAPPQPVNSISSVTVPLAPPGTKYPLLIHPDESAVRGYRNSGYDEHDFNSYL